MHNVALLYAAEDNGTYLAPFRFFPWPGASRNSVSRYGRPELDCRFEDALGAHNPCQKSIELERWLVRHFSKQGDTVLSLCCGSGSTILAALLEGRNAVGIDTNPTLACSRVQEFQDTELLLLRAFKVTGTSDEQREAAAALTNRRTEAVSSGKEHQYLCYKWLTELPDSIL